MSLQSQIDSWHRGLSEFSSRVAPVRVTKSCDKDGISWTKQVWAMTLYTAEIVYHLHIPVYVSIILMVYAYSSKLSSILRFVQHGRRIQVNPTALNRIDDTGSKLLESMLSFVCDF